MIRRRRLLIRQRRRIFLGCEGESERGYGALIGRSSRKLVQGVALKEFHN
jgi:hypothetical protein